VNGKEEKKNTVQVAISTTLFMSLEVLVLRYPSNNICKTEKVMSTATEILPEFSDFSAVSYK